MSRRDVWERLLWKEFREGWYVVLIALIAPAVCFPLAGRYQFDSWERGMFAFPGAAGVHLAVALWAAGRGAGKRQGSEFSRSHLPVHPFAEWAASFIVPLLVTSALGYWFGYWSGKVQPSFRTVSAEQAGALDLATTYAICYLMSAIISSWAAVLFGAFRVAAGTLINVWNLSPMTEGDVVWFVGRTALGALAGSLVFTALVQKKSLAFRQATSLLLMLAVVFVPAIGMDVSFLLPPKKAEWGIYGGHVVSEGRSVIAQVEVDDRPSVRLRCVNKRAGTDFRRDFCRQARLLGTAGERWVYVAEQPAARGPLRIVRWDSLTNRTAVVGSIDAGGEWIPPIEDTTLISRDGRHLLMTLESRIGNGVDLWMVDLTSGRSEIVIACSQGAWAREAVFLRDRVIVTGSGRAAAISYATFDATKFEISGVDTSGAGGYQPVDR